jgi:hypothetical protein
MASPGSILVGSSAFPKKKVGLRQSIVLHCFALDNQGFAHHTFAVN